MDLQMNSRTFPKWTVILTPTSESRMPSFTKSTATTSLSSSRTFTSTRESTESPATGPSGPPTSSWPSTKRRIPPGCEKRVVTRFRSSSAVSAFLPNFPLSFCAYRALKNRGRRSQKERQKRQKEQKEQKEQKAQKEKEQKEQKRQKRPLPNSKLRSSATSKSPSMRPSKKSRPPSKSFPTRSKRATPSTTLSTCTTRNSRRTLAFCARTVSGSRRSSR